MRDRSEVDRNPLPTTALGLTILLAATAIAIAAQHSTLVKLLVFYAGTIVLLLWQPLRASTSLQSVVALLFGSALLSAGFALEPGASLLGSVERGEGLLAWAALLATMCLAAQLGADERERLYRGIALLGALLGGYAGLQWLGIDPIDWQTEARPAATLGNALSLGGMLLLCIVPTALLAWRRRWHAWLLLPQLIGLAASGTRGAWLALLVVTALAAVLIGVPRRWRIAVVLLGAALVAWALPTRIESLHDRIELWQRASHAVAASTPLVDLYGTPDRHAAWRALVGHGPDQISAPLQSQANLQPRDAAQDLRADRAHQWLLDRWLAFGAIGFLASLCVALIVLLALRQRANDDRAEALALALALGAYALHLQVGFALLPDRALAFVLLGCALGTPCSVAQQRGVSLAAAGVLILFGIATLFAHPRLAADRAFAAGQDAYAHALHAGDHTALRDAAQAFAEAITLSRYDLDAGLAAASAEVEWAIASGDRDALARAEQWTSAVTAIRPGERRLRAVRDRIALARQTLAAIESD